MPRHSQQRLGSALPTVGMPMIEAHSPPFSPERVFSEDGNRSGPAFTQAKEEFVFFLLKDFKAPSAQKPSKSHCDRKT